MTYSIAGTYQRLVPNTSIDLGKLSVNFPDIPKLNSISPNITNLEYNPDTHKLIVRGHDFIPTDGKSSQFNVKVWLVPRGDQIDEPSGAIADRGLVYHGFTPEKISENELELTIDPHISLSLHDIYVERKAKITVNGETKVSEEKLQSTHRSLWDVNRYKNSLILSRDSIDIVQTNEKPNQFAFVESITKDENGNLIQFWGARTDSIAYSEDGKLAFVTAGLRDGKIYVVDTSMRAIVYTIHLKNQSGNISSLMVNDGWLYIAESDGLSSRLLRVLIDTTSTEYLKIQQTVDTGFQFASGISDMAVSADRYLGLVVPKGTLSIGNFYGNFREDKKGDIFVLDLAKIDKTGKVSSGGIVKVSESELSTINRGGSPEFITSGAAAGEFLVSFAKDTNRGVVGITAKTQGGNLTGDFKLSTTDKGLVPDNDPKGYRSRAMLQNIQRASETVIAEFEGETYAFVADYAFNFNDPTWNQWTEVPVFAFPAIYWLPVQIPQPQIGGKIGIIKDPFGYKGKPEYLGATSAINGGAIKSLTLTNEGVLEANVWMYDEPAPEGGSASKHTIFTWDAGALLSIATSGKMENKSQPIDRESIPSKYFSSTQYPEAIPKRFDTPDGVKDHEYGWIYGLETADADPNRLTSLKPTQITESLQKRIQNEISELVQKAKDGYTSYLEASIDLKITMAKRVYTELSILVTGTIAAQKAILHINNDNELNKLTQLRQEMASLTYEGGDTVLGQIEAGVYEFVDGLVNGLLEVPLVAIDTSLRLNLFLEHLLLQGLADVGVSIANIAGYDKEPYVLTPPQVGAFSSIVDEYDRDGDEAKFREKLKHMVIGFTPAGAYYAGKEFGDAWIDFGSSDKKDFKRVTTATLNLMLLGIGTKKAMAEYRASKEVLNHANEL